MVINGETTKGRALVPGKVFMLLLYLGVSGKIGFLPNGQMQAEQSQWHQFMCKHKLLTSSLSHSKWFLKVNNRNLLLRWCMKGLMIFCQKNILQHSLRFFWPYKKRSLLTMGILTRPTNIWNKVFSVKRIFHNRQAIQVYSWACLQMLNKPLQTFPLNTAFLFLAVGEEEKQC